MGGSVESVTAPRVDADGYRPDFTEWDAGLALRLAEAICVELTARSWHVARFLREEYYHTNCTPQPHRLLGTTGLSARELFNCSRTSPPLRWRTRIGQTAWQGVSRV